MSAIRQSKLTGVAPRTILAGAKALKMNVFNNLINTGMGRLIVGKDGSVRGDYDFIDKVGDIRLPDKIEERPKALVGILAQVGTTELLAERLISQGFTVEKNSVSGSIVATKGSQRIDFTINREGLIRREGTNYENNSCLAVLDTMLTEICSESIISTEMKTQPATVVRRAL